jgi:aminoglycoside 6'-N-acetyltransferase
MLDVRLDPFDSALHGELLLAWLRRPHVIKWWGDPAKAEEGLHLLTRPIDTHALIVVDGVAVGYLCWGKPPRDDLEAAGLSDLPEELIDVDILIGDPELIGRGIGPRALRLLLDRLRGDPSISLVGIGPSVLNARAIRAYEKVGFRRVGEFEDPDCGPSQYMTLKIRNERGADS